MPVFAFEPDGGFVDVNQMACEKLGYPGEEPLTLYVQDNDAGDDPAKITELWVRLASVVPITLEAACTRKDGNMFPVENQVSLVIFSREQCMFAPVNHITERKRAEEALFHRKRELAVLEERNCKAGDIHDTLALAFTGIVLRLEAGG